jgi:membrane associated rhomboid family serine protease
LAYITTGIAGFVASTAYSIAIEGFGGGLTAGASGAVFGITGMVLGMLYRQKSPQWKGFAVQAVLFQLLIGFGINQAGVGIMINNLAHLGGLVVGLMFGVAFATSKNSTRQPTRTEFLLNVGAIVGLLVCLTSLVLAQTSPIWRELEIAAGGR